MELQIGHTIYSFKQEEFQGHQYYSFKKVAFQPDVNGQKQKPKVQVLTVSPKDFEQFKGFLKDVINSN